MVIVSPRKYMVILGAVTLGLACIANVGAIPTSEAPSWDSPGEWYSYSFSQVFRDGASGKFISSGGTLWRGGEEWVVEEATQLGFRPQGSERDYLSFRQFGYADGLLAEHICADPLDGSWNAKRGARVLHLHSAEILALVPMWVPGVSIGLPWGMKENGLGDQVRAALKAGDVAPDDFARETGVLISDQFRYSDKSEVAKKYFVEQIAGRVVSKFKMAVNQEHGLLRVRCWDESGVFYAIELRSLRKIAPDEFSGVSQMTIVEEKDNRYCYRSGQPLTAIIRDFRLSNR